MKAKIIKDQRALDVGRKKTNERQREEQILENAPLVKLVAERMAIRLPPHISKDERPSSIDYLANSSIHFFMEAI